MLHSKRVFSRDCLDLLLCCLGLGVAWFALGWRPGLQFSRQDGLEYFYPALQVIRGAKVGLDGPAYDPYWLGGVKFASTWISPWFTKVFLLLGLPITDVVSLSLAVPQLFQAFLSLKILDGLLLWREAEPCKAWSERFGWVLLFAFMPAYAWKFAGGHFFYPSLLPLAAFALVLGLKLRSFSALGFFVTGGILASCLETQTYPQLGNAGVFGLPLVLLLAWQIRPWGRAELSLGALVAVSAICWSFRGHWESFAHFAGPDAARQAGGKELVYSFGIPTWRDWLGSLFWDGMAFPHSSDLRKIGEMNYPLGPLALPLLFGLRGRLRPFLLLLLALLATAALFASGVAPVADALLGIVWPLNYFRVPMRALFPLLVFVPPFAAAAMDYRPGKNSAGHLALGGAIAIGTLMIPQALVRELTIFLLLGLALFTGRVSPWRRPLLALLAAASLFAFHQRLPSPMRLTETEARTQELRESILRATPELQNPLVRATIEFTDDKFGPNTGRVLGLSTLDGYWQPLRRYNEFVYGAYGLSTMELALNYRIRPDQTESRPIYTAFNVGRRIRLEAGAVKVTLLGSAGNWAKLTGANGIGDCAGRRIEKAEVADPYFRVTAEVSGGPPCALVLATNFAENLRARGPTGTLRVFPAGPLAAIELPERGGSLELFAVRSAPAGLAIVSLAGLLLLLGASLGYARRRKE